MIRLWTYFDMLNLKRNSISNISEKPKLMKGHKHSINLGDTEPM